MTSNLALPLLNAGTCWQGGGWNSSSASKKLYELVGVPILSSDFSVYRGAFLYSLALFWEVEIPEVSLPDSAAAAAFALAKVYEDQSWDWIPKDKSAGPTQREDEGESENGENGEIQLPWDEDTTPLPPDLGELWRRAKQDPAKKIDLKALLDKVPCFEGLPRKPPVNNHRADQGRPLDKQMRAWQQTLLHILRLLTKVHLQSSGMEPEVRLLHAQGWQVLAELYHKLLEYRRECSVPGVASAQGSEEVLFSQEDLKMVKSVANINGMQEGKRFMPPGSLVAGLGAYSFRPHPLSDQGKGAKGPKRFFKGGYGSQYTPASYGSFGKGQGGPYTWKASGRGRGKGEPPSPNSLSWWNKNASPEVVKNIKYGIAPDWCCPSLPLLSIQKTAEEQFDCLNLLSDYLQLGAVREVTPQEVKFLVPWFLIKKPEGGYQSETYHRLQEAQLLSPAISFQDGPLENNFPLPPKRHVGGKDRPKTCLLQSGVIPKVKTLCIPAGRRQVLSVSSSLLWTQHPVTDLATPDEHFQFSLETKRSPGFH